MISHSFARTARLFRWVAMLTGGVVITLRLLLLTQVSVADEARPRGQARVEVSLSSVADKQFDNVQGLLEQQNWDAALDAIALIQRDYPDALVEAGDGHYLNASDYGRWIISTLPEAGLAAMRQHQDGWATQRFQDARQADRSTPLQQIITTAFSSSLGDDALWKLGEWYWEQGDIARARRCWSSLLTPAQRESGVGPDLRLHYPDTSLSAGQIVSRLMMCHLAERNEEAARHLSGQEADLDVTETGWLAGREGQLSEITADLLDAAGDWTRTEARSDWPTFARRSCRESAAPVHVHLAGPRWSMKLVPADTVGWRRSRLGLPAVPPAAQFPVVWQDLVIFHDGQRVRALRCDNGRPAWPNDADGHSGTIYPPFPIHLPPLPWPSAGVPRYTLTVADGLAVARLGPPLVSTGSAPMRVARRPWLVALDVEQEQGGLVWLTDDQALDGSDWMFAGAPVAAEGRLYVALIRSKPQHEFGVVCLDGRDGTVLWQTTVYQILSEVPAGLAMHGSHLLTSSEGLVFASTDTGAVAALDLRTGVIRWVVTYTSQPLQITDFSDEDRAGLLPPVYWAGRLFVKPNDSSDLMALDAQSGTRLWRRAVGEGIVHLLGVSGLRLMISGEQLWAVDVATGLLQWRFGSSDPAAFGYGRGAMTSAEVFWPTRDDLWVIDAQSGRAVQRIPLRAGYDLSGGNIVLSADRLLIAGPDHLTAFGLEP